MREYMIDEKKYRLPNSLNKFQLKMYIHFVNYKWNELKICEPGEVRRKGRVCLYDTMFPREIQNKHYPLYGRVLKRFLKHQENCPFRIHPMAKHMASSQIACANLFLPLMIDPDVAAQVLQTVKPDLARIDTDSLDNGFKIEFWTDRTVAPDDEKGLLGDHSKISGTDADFAIAYRDTNDNLCLWLIEHKLTESGFTKCGGAKSKKRSKKHCCDYTPDILNDPKLCYYHSIRHFKYWDLTLKHSGILSRASLESETQCPFKGGVNQLWRNQLLAYAIEKSSWPYKKVFFSVVYHPKNPSLINYLKTFKKLLNNTDRFSWFTSDQIINAAKEVSNIKIEKWVGWYEKLYYPSN